MFSPSVRAMLSSKLSHSSGVNLPILSRQGSVCDLTCSIERVLSIKFHVHKELKMIQAVGLKP